MLFPENQSWRVGMQDMAAAANEVMGECVLVTPATIPAINFPSIPDPSKAVTVTAIFTNKARTVLLGNEGKIGGHSLSPLVETREPIFQFSYGSLPFELQQGYRLTRLCNGVSYEITNIRPDGVAFIFVNVVQLGRPT